MFYRSTCDFMDHLNVFILGPTKGWWVLVSNVSSKLNENWKEIRLGVPSPPPPHVCLPNQNVHPPYLSLTISFPNASDGFLSLASCRKWERGLESNLPKLSFTRLVFSRIFCCRFGPLSLLTGLGREQSPAGDEEQQLLTTQIRALEEAKSLCKFKYKLFAKKTITCTSERGSVV